MHRVFNRYFSLKVCVIDSFLWKMKIQQRNILLATLVPTIRSNAHAKEQLVSYAFQNIALSQQTSRRLNEFRSDSFKYWSFDVHFEDWLSIGYEIDWTARHSIAVSDETRERVRGTVRPRAGSAIRRKGRCWSASFGSLVLVDRAITLARVLNQEAVRLQWHDSTIRVYWKWTKHEVISTDRGNPSLSLSLSPPPSPFLSFFLFFRRCLANESSWKKLTIKTILNAYRVDSLFLNPGRGILFALTHPFLHDIPFLSFLFSAY